MLVFLMILGCCTALAAAVVQWFKEKKNGEKHHNYTLVFVFMGAVLATITSILQSIDSEKSEKKLIESYNILKEKSDSNSFQIIKTLAQYGLEYNQSQKRIVQLVRDSIKTNKTTIVNSDAPTLVLSTIEGRPGLDLSEDKTSFKYTFLSQNAATKNINLFASLAYADNFEDLKTYISDGNLDFVKGLNIAKNYESSSRLLRDSSIHYNYLIIWPRGTYQNAEMTKTYSYDEVILYSFKDKSTSELTGDLKLKVMNWMIKRETRAK